MSVTTITVRGHHSVKQAPERAEASLSVAVDGAGRQAVVDSANALHTEISESLKKLDGASVAHVTHWSADTVRVWSDRPWSNTGDRLPLVHHAQADFTARFSDFTALSNWLALFSDRDGISVTGVAWSLSHSSESALREQAQLGAVESATAKATAYARALGLTSVRAVELADAGMLPAVGTPTMPGGAALRSAAAFDSPSQSLTLNPAAVSIDATVDARYEAS
jgi:uncharacterized protein YggE